VLVAETRKEAAQLSCFTWLRRDLADHSEGTEVRKCRPHRSTRRCVTVLAAARFRDECPGMPLFCWPVLLSRGALIADLMCPLWALRSRSFN
jgi:hypothetical protein